MTLAERVQWVLDRMLKGEYTGWTIDQVTDKISWLWKWKKISDDQLTLMTSQARYLLGDLDAFDVDEYFSKEKC